MTDRTQYSVSNDFRLRGTHNRSLELMELVTYRMSSTNLLIDRHIDLVRGLGPLKSRKGREIPFRGHFPTPFLSDSMSHLSDSCPSLTGSHPYLSYHKYSTLPYTLSPTEGSLFIKLRKKRDEKGRHIPQI